MSYFVFLVQWYNWPYLAGIGLGLASLARPARLGRLGERSRRLLGFRRASGHVIVRVFSLSMAVAGLTINGALHDYWPSAQERGFLPGLVVSTLLALLVTRWIGGIFDRHFPEIKAIAWGSPDLSGRAGRVVSRLVSPDYRAGRAQVMGEDETLHMVLCKTGEGEIPYGAEIVLGDYDAEDGRYFVRSIGSESDGEDGAKGTDAGSAVGGGGN